jgi:serine/threonine-protein kinase
MDRAIVDSVSVAAKTIVLPRAGDVLLGKYRLAQVIGEGAMAVVYRAEHLGLRRDVAVKVLTPAASLMDGIPEHFQREARLLAQVRHPNVVGVLDVDALPNGLPFIVLEYLRGHDVEVEIARRGRLGLEEAVGIVRQAAEAMAAVHAAGIVHRDLKPSNLFLCEADEGGPGRQPRRTVKIVDFGVSRKIHDESRATATNMTFGTPSYMSPEQISEPREVDSRADVWSLGAILFELVTGRLPFEAQSATAVIAAVVTQPVPSPTEFRPDLPPGLEAVILRALDKDRTRRYRSVGALSCALEPFALGVAPGEEGDAAIPLVRVREEASPMSEAPLEISGVRAAALASGRIPWYSATLIALFGGAFVVLAVAHESPPSEREPVLGGPPPVVTVIPSVAPRPAPTASGKASTTPSASARRVVLPPVPVAPLPVAPASPAASAPNGTLR